MLPSLLELRRKVVFPGNARTFIGNAQDFLRQLSAAPIGDREAAAELAGNLWLDLKSHLSTWNIAKLLEKGELPAGEAKAAADELRLWLEKTLPPDRMESLRTEAESIAASQTRLMSEKALTGSLSTFWGHDYCTGIDHSLRRGACFSTSNPAKINLFRKENPEIWAKLVEEARAERPGISLERLISALFVKVTAVTARILHPIFAATGGERGFVCVQVNPLKIHDSAAMLEEVRFWEDAYRRELGVDRVNVVYKLPAVKEAVPVTSELVAEGIRVCLTLNFSLTQHEVFADLIQKGRRSGFVVMMSGFLDDNVAKELGDLGIADPIRHARHAGVAVTRKSHANLVARGIDKAFVMAAAIRGDYTIRSCLTDNAAAPICFTTMTAKIEEFDAEPRRLTPETAEETPADVMAVLEKSSIFRQAYRRDGLGMDDLPSFVPLKAVLKAFTDAYRELAASLA